MPDPKRMNGIQKLKMDVKINIIKTFFALENYMSAISI